VVPPLFIRTLQYRPYQGLMLKKHAILQHYNGCRAPSQPTRYILSVWSSEMYSEWCFLPLSPAGNSVKKTCQTYSFPSSLF